MKTIAVATQKGGQGKTTIALHLAFAAEEMDLKVLYVDMDEQGNGSLVLAGDSRIAYESGYSALTTGALFDSTTGGHVKPLVTEKNIDLIAPDPLLPKYIQGTFDPGSPALAAPRTVLAQFAQEYDLCVIDAPPAQGQVLAALLAASDAVISPMSIDLFSIDGVGNLLETITQVRDAVNPALMQLGIVPNQVNTRSKGEMSTLKDLRSAYGALITPYAFNLRYAVKAAISSRKPVWKGVSGTSHSKAAKEWKDNCRTVLEQLDLLESN
ncbi:hypothetical protein Nstercoris_02275 (plasmid) [Nitrosomonas stercoris]|uniref:AAA domain-containing protein n=1 Tax=Nitrosomonas stercoris TaxID=1444684 RepID=A0A4Y1YP95_9PROT|nr:hypothetical protein Nstercoris_02275 [Nitrosomonas stercoris]